MRMRPDQARMAADNLLKHNALPGVTIDQLAGVLVETTLVRMQPGDALCVEGEPAQALFFLLAGQVRVQRRDSAGTMRELAVVTGPSMVGHMALVDNQVRSASCLAQTRCAIAQLDRQSYNTLIHEATEPGRSLRRLLLVSLSDQLTRGNAKIRQLIHVNGVDIGATHAKKASKEKKSTLSLRMEAQANDAGHSDISETDLLKVAGLLEGWDVDMDDLNQMKVVIDEEQKRWHASKSIK